MWRKSEAEPERSSSNPSPPSSSSSSAASARSASRGGERAVIGPSISIHGDVTGEEDLVVQGRVEGKIDLKQNNVTIGKDGRVKADIYGRVIEVEGEVRGNLFGDEQIMVAQSGQVVGNITAPRVTLADGCRFKGSIDMEPKSSGRSTSSASRSASSSSASSKSGSSSGSSSPASSTGSADKSEAGGSASGASGASGDKASG